MPALTKVDKVAVNHILKSPRPGKYQQEFFNRNRYQQSVKLRNIYP